MTINYNVQAEVIDLGKDTPKDTDIFLVDSNVWFWLAYPNAGNSGITYQLSDYPNYVNRALAAGAKILRSGLSLAELSHLIEKTEREIYAKAICPISTKEYRHNQPSERTRIASEVRAAWGSVKSLATPLAETMDDPTTNAALLRFQTQPLDGYDLFLIYAMERNGVTQIITDDGDYCTVPGIQVYTSNHSVLKTATTQGKLLVR